MPQNALELSRKVDECKPLPCGAHPAALAQLPDHPPRRAPWSVAGGVGGGRRGFLLRRQRQRLVGGRGLHSCTYQLNLTLSCHWDPAITQRIQQKCLC